LHRHDTLFDAVYPNEVFEAAAGLVEVEEILEALLALEVELTVVHPDVLADFEGDEEIEDGCFALVG
jgi:hypothetical protein